MTVKQGHEEYLELAAIYALGALDGEDRNRFETHLASGCDLCRNAVLESEEVLGDLALAAPLAAPPASIRERLFEKVRRDSNESKVKGPGVSRFWMALAAAAMLATVGLGLYARQLHERVLERTETADRERLAREGLERDLENLSQTLEAFTAPATRAVSLAGQGEGQGAAAKAFLDTQNRRLFLYVYNLPQPPPGRTFQLWLIIGNQPVSMGVFGVEPDGRGRLDTASIPAFTGDVTVAVTIEPLGGVPQPTGPIILMGS